MVATSQAILQELLELTRANINAAESFKTQPNTALNWKQNPESWSALECIAHLNRYGDFYIPEITQKIKTAKHKSAEAFQSNWLGKYFSKTVAYKENLNKMKTFKSMNPLNSVLDVQTLETFIKQQHQIIELLNQAQHVHLDKTKTAISISKWIKLRLGDTFRVLIYHNERHIKQAEKALQMATLTNVYSG
ncbi:MAG: DinB family protein [Bacteroidota bacterium]